MRLKLVEPKPHFGATCIACGKHMDSAQERIYADLDGPAFKAYYCVDDALYITHN